MADTKMAWMLTVSGASKLSADEWRKRKEKLEMMSQRSKGLKNSRVESVSHLDCKIQPSPPCSLHPNPFSLFVTLKSSG